MTGHNQGTPYLACEVDVAVKHVHIETPPGRQDVHIREASHCLVAADSTCVCVRKDLVE